MGSAMGKDQPLKKARKHLSADALFRHLYASFEQVPDGQPPDASISLADALMSGFALFALKDPSLLAFDQRRRADVMGPAVHQRGSSPAAAVLDRPSP